MSQRQKLSKPEPRLVSLCARFTPEGPDATERKAFADFLVAVIERLNALRRRKQASDKARFAKVSAASRKLWPLFRDVSHDRLPPGAAKKKMNALVPDRALARAAFDRWAAAVTSTPEPVAQHEEDRRRRRVEIARCVKLSQAEKAAIKGLSALGQAAVTGDADAVPCLVNMARLVDCFLAGAEKSHPEMVRRVARKQTCWPVLARDEPGWEKEAAARVATLDLGSGLQILKVRFRQARGTDANLPARRWAKAAVRTLEETLVRFLTFGQLLREFGSCEAFVEFTLEAGWEMTQDPDYLRELAHLAAFSEKSLPGWKRVVRKLIPHALPEFHTRPEWTTRRNTAAASGRDSPGQIQHAILDDIVSALERLAPP